MKAKTVKVKVSEYTVLGIDTSNYTSSAAVYFKDDIIQSKKLLPVKDGQVGLRQSDAVFFHTKQLAEVLNPLLLEYKAIDVIAVADKPRSIEGSYMPCFLVGENTGEILSAALGVPLFKFSHQEGHIAAALFSCKKTELLSNKFIALHLSGGTSEILLVENKGEPLPEIKIIGNTLDLNAGQAIDRTAVKMGLPFPGGRYIDELALKFSKKINTKTSTKGIDFSLSGIENKCSKMIEENVDKEEISAMCLSLILNNIEKCLLEAVKLYGDLPIIFSGGVSSSAFIRKNISKNFDSYFASPQFSADNAAGIAYLGRRVKNEGVRFKC